MYIVTYRLYETVTDMEISVMRNDKHIGKSPFFLGGKYMQKQKSETIFVAFQIIFGKEKPF